MYNLGSGDWIGLPEAAKICSEVFGSARSEEDVFKMGYIEYSDFTSLLKIYSFPREWISIAPYDSAKALKIDSLLSPTEDERVIAFSSCGPGNIFELNPCILEPLLSLRTISSDQMPGSAVIRASSYTELPRWEHVAATDDGKSEQWTRYFDGVISPKIEIVWKDLRVDRHELLTLLDELKSPTASTDIGMGVPMNRTGKNLTSNERNTLLVIIAGLCKKCNIGHKDRDAASTIAKSIDELGVSVHQDTVRAKLKLIDDAVANSVK